MSEGASSSTAAAMMHFSMLLAFAKSFAPSRPPSTLTRTKVQCVPCSPFASSSNSFAFAGQVLHHGAKKSTTRACPLGRNDDNMTVEAEPLASITSTSSCGAMEPIIVGAMAWTGRRQNGTVAVWWNRERRKPRNELSAEWASDFTRCRWHHCELDRSWTATTRAQRKPVYEPGGVSAANRGTSPPPPDSSTPFSLSIACASPRPHPPASAQSTFTAP